MAKTQNFAGTFLVCFLQQRKTKLDVSKKGGKQCLYPEKKQGKVCSSASDKLSKVNKDSFELIYPKQSVDNFTIHFPAQSISQSPWQSHSSDRVIENSQGAGMENIIFTDMFHN